MLQVLLEGSSLWTAVRLWHALRGCVPSARWAAPLKETSLRMPCILVIDDDPELRGVVREMLEGAGYAVLEASDGHAGVPIDHLLCSLDDDGYNPSTT